VTPGVELRDFRIADTPTVHRWFNDRETTATLLEQRESFSEAEARAWVERAAEAGGEDRKWAVTVDGATEPAGFVALYGLGRQTAPELGILIGDPEQRGRGVGREAIRQALARAFEAGTHRVYVRILAGNDASRHAFESFGFRREGVMRAHVRRGAALLDCEIWGLLPEEFEAARERGGEGPG
jgi:RimJ/RimL family protein N-acetyltransferase